MSDSTLAHSCELLGQKLLQSCRKQQKKEELMKILEVCYSFFVLVFSRERERVLLFSFRVLRDS